MAQPPAPIIFMGLFKRVSVGPSEVQIELSIKDNIFGGPLLDILRGCDEVEITVRRKPR